MDSVSSHPVRDELERESWLKVGDSLRTAPPTEVERVLPSVLQHAHSGNEVRVRIFAVGFLRGIAQRPDGAKRLSAKSEELSSLIVDPDPGVGRFAVAVTDYVIGKAGTNKQPYVSALEAAMQRKQTPQDVTLGMVGPLLFLGVNDPNALHSVLDFVHRDDLTADTRRELAHSLGTVHGLPEEINQYLSKILEDPDPAVRVAALVAFADSTTRFHALSMRRVKRMASDPHEDPRLRKLANEAIAGRTNLDPNVLLPKVERSSRKPKDR